MQRPHRTGFTLVELAIVLVIIGLIIGGVLAGNDLILTAKRQKIIRKWEQIDAAVLTFRNKYNGLPGDFRNASRFFPGYDSSWWGNNDGRIAPDSFGHGGIGMEVCDFWSHLSAAQLIPETIAPCDAFSRVETHTPTLPFNPRSNTVVFAAAPGNPHYFVTNSEYNNDPTIWVPTQAGAHMGTGAFTPGDARWLDSKLDDGLARKGNFMLSEGGTGPVADANSCIDLTTSDEYARDGGNVMLEQYPRNCHAIYRTAF